LLKLLLIILIYQTCLVLVFDNFILLDVIKDISKSQFMEHLLLKLMFWPFVYLKN